MKNKIIIVSGDPNSINSEIIFKCWKKLNYTLKKNIYLISNYDLLKDQFRKLGYKINVQRVDNINEKVDKKAIKVININLILKTHLKYLSKKRLHLLESHLISLIA